MVEWDPVPTCSENGIVQFYMVKYEEPDSESKSLDARNFSAFLSGNENTLYLIQVAAATSKGVGKFSEPIN